MGKRVMSYSRGLEGYRSPDVVVESARMRPLLPPMDCHTSGSLPSDWQPQKYRWPGPPVLVDHSDSNSALHTQPVIPPGTWDRNVDL